MADAILSGTANGRRLGSVVTCADANNDGYDDAILASPWSDNIFIFHSQGASGLITQNTDAANFFYQTGVGSDNFGHYAAMGDVNGDGYQDLLVAENLNFSSLGRIFVFVSLEGSLPNQPQQFVYSPTDPAPGCSAGGGCRFGTSFVVDYFNSDNCIDLAVGAPNFNSNQGIVFVFHSTCDGINPYPTMAKTTLLGPPTTSCNANSCFFGSTLASGDTNGDGFSDLLVGASGASSGIGDVYLVLNNITTGIRGLNLHEGGTADSLFSGSINLGNFSLALQFLDTSSDGLQDIILSEPTTANKVYTFHRVRGSVPVSQNLNGTGVASQTFTPPAGTFMGNSVAELKNQAEGYLWYFVDKTKKVLSLI